MNKMTSTAKTRGQGKLGHSKETDNKTLSTNSVSSDAISHDELVAREGEVSLVQEMRKLREENSQGHKRTTKTLERLEKTVTDIKEQLGDHQQRIGELEGRVSDVEDAGTGQHRVIRYLFQREKQLTAVCDDLQNRLRRNNLRIFQIPEESEHGDVVAFVKALLPKVLTLPPNLDIRIERAHRSLQLKPMDPAAPPRSIIVRFLDATVKDIVLQQAWSQGIVMFQDKRIFFDQDYSPELQKKRAKVHAIIKQLRQRGIQAKCLYPARLKIKMDSGEKTFSSLTSAADTLREMGVEVQCGEKERIEEKLTGGWNISAKRRTNMLALADLKDMIQEEEE